LGDHIKAKRLDLNLLQKDVAEYLHTDIRTIHNWETGKSVPLTRYYPDIMDFLGYCPYKSVQTHPQRLKAFRLYTFGFSQSQMAEKLGVDTSTYWGWESGKKVPTKRLRTLVDAVLSGISSKDIER